MSNESPLNFDTFLCRESREFFYQIQNNENFIRESFTHEKITKLLARTRNMECFLEYKFKQIS